MAETIDAIYEDGVIKPLKKINLPEHRHIKITIDMEDIETPVSEKLDLNKFSFTKSRDLLKSYKGSLSDAIIEERRSEV